MELSTNGWNTNWPGDWLLQRVFEGAPESQHPAAEVVEDQDAFRFYFDVPGVKAESLEVKLENGTLTLSGERARTEPAKSAKVHLSERAFGKFHRAFQMPERVGHGPVSASYRDGVLEVVIAKPAEAKPIKIEISLN